MICVIIFIVGFILGYLSDKQIYFEVEAYPFDDEDEEEDK